MQPKKVYSEKAKRLREQLGRIAPCRLIAFGESVSGLAAEVKAFSDRARKFRSRAEARQFTHEASAFLQKVSALDQEGKKLCSRFDVDAKALSGDHADTNFLELREYQLHQCAHELDSLIHYIALTNVFPK